MSWVCSQLNFFSTYLYIFHFSFFPTNTNVNIVLEEINCNIMHLLGASHLDQVTKAVRPSGISCLCPPLFCTKAVGVSRVLCRHSKQCLRDANERETVSSSSVYFYPLHCLCRASMASPSVFSFLFLHQLCPYYPHRSLISPQCGCWGLIQPTCRGSVIN
jgi:hypothetical protein